MVTMLNSRLGKKEYDTISDPIEFSEVVTKNLQSVSKDKHIRVNYDPHQAADIKNRTDSGAENDDHDYLEMMRNENYGVKKVEILNGNIGYLDLSFFAHSKFSQNTIEAAMRLVENCNAIIIDLRQNSGGNPDGVRLVCSYFFDDKPVHLNDIYYRPENKKEEYWTLPELNGRRMPDIDLYVLTSKFTFSAAEEFAYDLKNLKRAVIIGEKTGGGAHPGDIMAIDDNFVIFVPTGRAVNPVTKTDWEGKGVRPDYKTSSDRALETAELKALEKISKTIEDSVKRKNFEWQAGVLKAILKPVNINDSNLIAFAGNYGDRIIIYSKSKLYYQRIGKQKYQLVPLTKDTFGFREIESFRIRFEKDERGKVTGITGIYSDGHTDSSKKIR
jgi:hypothetical protein